MTCDGCGQHRWKFCACGDRRCLTRRCVDCGHVQQMTVEELAARDRPC